MFAAANLLALAQARYGEEKLRDRMRGAQGRLSRLVVVSGGTGYGSPTVTITPVDGGSGATATATVVGGVVTALVLTNPGSGYRMPPTVAVVGGGGSGATAIAVLVADDHLLNIAQSVISRVQSAAQKSVGWPLPGQWPAGSVDQTGTDITGENFADVWPGNLIENALQLFNWRTLAGLEAIPDNARQVGIMAEKYFLALESGEVAIGLGDVDVDVGQPLALSVRDRAGNSSIASVPSRPNIIDAFTGYGWDR